MRTHPDFSHREVVFCEAKCVDKIRTVQVLIPSHEFKAKATDIPDEADKPYPFNVVTPVINFEICEIKSKEKRPWTTKDDPFELRVAYTKDDWNRSKENGHIRPWLAKWVENEGWKKYELVEIDSFDGIEENGGFLIVMIPDWVDPPIGIV